MLALMMNNINQRMLYGDGITSFSAADDNDDDMLVERCSASSCNIEDEIDTQACLSWG